MFATDEEVTDSTRNTISVPLPAPRGQHKRRQLVHNLRAMASKMQAHDRFPSVSELEKHFRVSTTTVEAALGELQAEGLIVRRRGSGTFIAEVSRATGTSITASQEQRTGRLVITSIGASQGVVNIFTAMAWALEAEMRAAGFDPLLLFDNHPQTRLNLALQRWEAKSVDGYIHLGSLGPDVVFPPMPGVVIGELPGRASLPVHQVVVDNFGAGKLAGEYLWNLGHRTIAFMTAEGMISAPPRLAGLGRAIEERGGSPQAAITYVSVPPGLHHTFPARVEAVLHDLFRREPQQPTPTAIFFANDLVAFPALQILLSWGIKIPQDLSVLSFDDTPGLASQTRPALTSLRMPTLGLGALAVQALHESVQNPATAFRCLRLPAELIVRESTGPARPTDRPDRAGIVPPPVPLEENS